MKNRRLAFSVLVPLAALLAAWPSPTALGDDGPAPASPDDTANAPLPGDMDLLGAPYKSERHDFIVSPPLGTKVVTKSGSGLDMLYFVDEKRKVAGSVRISVLERDMAPDALLKATAADVAAKFRGVQVLESKTLVISGKPAGKLVLSLVMDDGKDQSAVLRQQLLVQSGSSQYHVLSFYCPLKMKDDAIPIFDAMVRSFHVMDHKEVIARRMAAANLGKSWLMKNVTAEDLRAKRDATPSVFRIDVADHDVGYLTVAEVLAEGPHHAAEDESNRRKGMITNIGSVDGFDGIALMTDSTTFPSNDVFIQSHSQSFWAYSAQPGRKGRQFYSSWNRTVQTRKRNPAGGWQTNTTTQTGVQQAEPDDTFSLEIFTTLLIYDDPHHPVAPSNSTHHWKIPQDEPALLPPALEWLWPRLADLGHAKSMAFVSYNPGQEKLGLRTVGVGGMDSITVNGQDTRAIHLTDELDPSTTDMWVDKDGKMLMLKTTDGTTLKPSTTEEMEERWGKRIQQQQTEETILAQQRQQQEILEEQMKEKQRQAQQR